MNKGMTMFSIGLVMFMFGIYLSTNWAIIGTLMGVVGGIIMGSSKYFLVKKYNS
ncbi:hypothetical protein [Neobacillus sp. SuZ13]|uniref:hypothetical protein n=1 Tax=Neobacillus sp. SuZ13 TaxID=3047875 RepID=UPI0024BFEC95|nr:hypothetical protein [Neobacillus sp. SuZ13]WHY69602.1 hypothetical protein QNH17_13620 [Neobacillus sp. SuZ13]